MHQRVELTRDHAFDGACGDVLIDAFFLQEVIERWSDPSLLFLRHVISLFRFSARFKSCCAVFSVFLMKPCSKTMRPSSMVNRTRAMRPCVKVLLTSQRLVPSARTRGMPIGHENSTSLMSWPMIFRSAASRLLIHSRTGHAPMAIRRKKREGASRWFSYQKWYENSRTKWGDINCFRPAKAAPVTVPVLWSGMRDAAPRPGHGSKLRVESSREDRHRPAVGVVGGIGHELVIGGQRDLLVERVCVIGLEDALAA